MKRALPPFFFLPPPHTTRTTGEAGRRRIVPSPYSLLCHSLRTGHGVHLPFIFPWWWVPSLLRCDGLLTHWTQRTSGGERFIEGRESLEGGLEGGGCIWHSRWWSRHAGASRISPSRLIQRTKALFSRIRDGGVPRYTRKRKWGGVRFRKERSWAVWNHTAVRADLDAF